MVGNIGVSLRTTNYSSKNGVLYAHADDTQLLVAIDLCDFSVIGAVNVPALSGNNPTWGHYSDGEYIYLPVRGSNQVYRVSMDPTLFTMPATNSATLFFTLSDGAPMGMTSDGEGNFYVIESQNFPGSGSDVKIVKYNPSGVFIKEIITVNDNGNNANNGEEGWWGARAIVYSETTNYLYVGSRENCVTAFDTSLTQLVTLNIGNPANGDPKAISIVKECCPVSTSAITKTVCSSGNGEKFFLQDFLDCGDGIVCEGQWSVETANGNQVFNACDLSISVNGSGCGTYVLEKTTAATGNQQCGAFRIEVTICTEVPAATISASQSTCTGATPNNDGKITLTAATNADKFGVSTGATYSGTPDYAAATTIGALPQDVQTNIPNAGGTYTIRLFNGADDCFVDQTVTVAEVICVAGCTQPTGVALTPTAPTCTGATANNDGKITLASVTNGTHYGISTGATYTGPTTIATATAISGTPDVQTAIPNAGATYTIRIFNGADDCFVDQTVTVAEVICVASCTQPTGVALTPTRPDLHRRNSQQRRQNHSRISNQRHALRYFDRCYVYWSDYDCYRDGYLGHARCADGDTKRWCDVHDSYI
jgi:predicted metal-binding protein